MSNSRGWLYFFSGPEVIFIFIWQLFQQNFKYVELNHISQTSNNCVPCTISYFPSFSRFRSRSDSNPSLLACHANKFPYTIFITCSQLTSHWLHFSVQTNLILVMPRMWCFQYSSCTVQNFQCIVPISSYVVPLYIIRYISHTSSFGYEELTFQ